MDFFPAFVIIEINISFGFPVSYPKKHLKFNFPRSANKMYVDNTAPYRAVKPIITFIIISMLVFQVQNQNSYFAQYYGRIS